jgi:hypothetical protein
VLRNRGHRVRQTFNIECSSASLFKLPDLAGSDETITPTSESDESVPAPAIMPSDPARLTPRALE